MSANENDDGVLIYLDYQWSCLYLKKSEKRVGEARNDEIRRYNLDENNPRIRQVPI